MDEIENHVTTDGKLVASFALEDGLQMSFYEVEPGEVAYAIWAPERTQYIASLARSKHAKTVVELAEAVSGLPAPRALVDAQLRVAATPPEPPMPDEVSPPVVASATGVHNLSAADFISGVCNAELGQWSYSNCDTSVVGGGNDWIDDRTGIEMGLTSDAFDGVHQIELQYHKGLIWKHSIGYVNVAGVHGIGSSGSNRNRRGKVYDTVPTDTYHSHLKNR